jgi:hypothetical protein
VCKDVKGENRRQKEEWKEREKMGKKMGIRQKQMKDRIRER